MPSLASSRMTWSTSATSSGIEGARDLVEQHEVRLHRESAHDRDALLLPAGQPVGILLALVGEAEAGEELVGS